MKTLKLLIYSACTLGVLCLFGCSKDESAAPETTGYTPSPAPAETYQPAAAPRPAASPNQNQPEAFPGEHRIRAALANQDYNAAVAMLFSIKPTAEQFEAYHRLYGEVKDAVIQASSQDPKAAQALMAMDMATQPMPRR